MNISVGAVYEQGCLRLEEPVSLPDGAHVTVTLSDAEPSVDGQAAARALSEIAAMPLEGERSAFSGRDHDRVLYREEPGA